MAKKVQRARLLLPDGTDLSNYVTHIDIPVNADGLTEVTAKFVGVTLATDPETGQITITVGQ